MKKTLIVTVLVLAASLAVQAGVTQPPDQVAGWWSNTTNTQVMADDFAAPITGQITVVEWWGLFYPSNLPTSDTFTIRVFTDSSGSPGAKISDESTAIVPISTGISAAGYDEYYYSMALTAPVALTSGANYWISILCTNGEWCWETGSGGNGINAYTLIPPTFETGWGFFSDDQAMVITVVPEPGSIALFGIGIAAVVLRRRSAKK